MYSVNCVSKRFFEFKINDKIYEIKPAKIKALRKIEHLSKAEKGETFEELVSALSVILSNNVQNRKFTADEIEEYFDMDTCYDFLNEYINWLNGEREKN